MIYRIPLENGTVDVCGEPNKFMLSFDPALAEKRMSERLAKEEWNELEIRLKKENC